MPASREHGNLGREGAPRKSRQRGLEALPERGTAGGMRRKA